MFEKSLYDLIRGLRHHRGNERAYVQASIRECRNEIKGQDMDLKATAVLKLTYLEMFGHDMSWASFNILEVMSSQKYLQKRVGYLGAVQSFRPDTEVLMLAENLLKKDLTSPQHLTMALTLGAIPHVINPSMANSLLSDLLSRLTHSSPSIRKKTAVTLYRLALVYPETLRLAWPKIKDRLTDENEDPSVTAAVVNVVCELGWRRPHDFLPLAPRLFELLVSGGNNWMAIKIIKLVCHCMALLIQFATLTPLEPRLINKLLPPLTNLIRTTPAMSLLYECINGIITGRILENAQGTTRGDELARLCVGKLRGMLLIEGDPNCRFMFYIADVVKYVALLAFNRIVELHPYLVTSHEDVVLECIDDDDISIRLRALDLVVGMVNPQNLQSIVNRLLRQFSESPFASSADDPVNDRASPGVIPMADSESDMEETIKPGKEDRSQLPALPEDYRASVILKILEMCSRDTYASMNDFDWYIDVLVRLVRCLPSADEPAARIGFELRNVAVRVKSSRTEAVHAAELLLSIDRRADFFPAGNGGQAVLQYAAWVAGEFASSLRDARGLLESLLGSAQHLAPAQLAPYLHAVIKIYAHLTGDDDVSWTPEHKTMASLLTAKVSHFYEQFNSHPNLEVQERAVEYLELSRLAGEAIASHNGDTPPLLLTQAIPSLFSGMELNPVAVDTQQRIPVPEDLDLEQPINANLQHLLNVDDFGLHWGDDEVFKYYHEKPTPAKHFEPAANKLSEAEYSYQTADELLSPDALARKKAEQRERHRDDPYYIPSSDTSGRATPLGSLIRNSNGGELDVDAIPIMKLDLEANSEGVSQPTAKRKPRKKFEILGDETLDGAGPTGSAARIRPQRSLLQVDSSGLGSLSLSDGGRGRLDAERQAAEEAEMAAAMKEVERLRLEMQRDAERIEMAGPADGAVIKRKKKKKAGTPAAEHAQDGQPPAPAKKKKKAVKTAPAADEGVVGDEPVGEPAGEPDAAKPKKKKKRRQITFDDAQGD